MNLGPPLPSEIAKAPWRPRAAGTVAFFFGPMAGALVVAISLRRMGYRPAAKKVMLIAVALAAGEAAILFIIPEIVSRLVGFGAEIAFVLIFPAFMEKQFNEWQATHPSVPPSSGWSAIGWGVLGIVLFLAIVFLMFITFQSMTPARL